MREVAGRNIDLLLECGFTKPVALLKLGDKSDLIHAVTLHKVVLCSLAELDQFRSGMATLGVAESLQQYHPLYASFYCMGSGDSLTSGMIKTMHVCTTSYDAVIFLKDCIIINHADGRLDVVQY